MYHFKVLIPWLFHCEATRRSSGLILLAVGAEHLGPTYAEYVDKERFLSETAIFRSSANCVLLAHTNQ
jgi:hypothetical protein